jgi:hypothetical protein
MHAISLGNLISELEGLDVQKFERVDGACFNDVLGERIDFAAIAVHADIRPSSVAVAAPTGR